MLFQTINKLEQYTLCMTNSPGIFLSCKNMYPETKYVKFALGAHPCEIHNSSIIKEFKYCIGQSNYIGEVGLDFSKKYEKNKQLQINVFSEIVKMGTKHNKLISVHSRKSEEMLIDILRQYRPAKCIIHWFDGSKKHLQELINLGCYFSLNSNMMSENKIHSYLINIPKDKILIESDGPYTKVQGKRYKPVMLKEVYHIVGNILEIENLDTVISNNFKKILIS
jgi:TatD DNase family protein